MKTTLQALFFCALFVAAGYVMWLDSQHLKPPMSCDEAIARMETQPRKDWDKSPASWPATLERYRECVK